MEKHTSASATMNGEAKVQVPGLVTTIGGLTN
jgi:hypothetical protein